MYASYFGLRQKPFNTTPDPRFLYTNRCYQEAYATLLYGIAERKGFIALTGEVGTGKTTLLRRLMDSVNPTIKVVFVYNTTVTFDELVEFICGELDIAVSGLARVARLQALNRFLLAEAKGGSTVVLLLDEAQNLSSEALENLRLISNLETATDKLLQIVLVGQPELEAKLADPALRQVTQRIAIRFRLEPLDDSEVEPYIDYRLRVVGRSRKDLFSDKAIRTLVRHVNGIPRLINVICDNALALAYATDRPRVDDQMIESVLSDLRLRPPDPRPAPRAAEAGRREPPAHRPAWPAWARAASTRALRPASLAVAAGVALTLLAVAAAGFGGASGVARHLPPLGVLTERALGWGQPQSATTASVPAPEGQAAPERPSVAAGAESEATQPAAAPVTEPVEPPTDERGPRAPDIATIASRTLTVPAGGTISGIVFEHYGRHSSLALDLVHELNPAIRDVDVVMAGQQVRLPQLNPSTLLRRQADGSYRLIISSQPSLMAARQVVRTVRTNGYSAAVTTRDVAADHALYRVEINSLKNRAVAIRAWETARRLGWFEPGPEATDRGSRSPRVGLSVSR